MQEFAHGHGVIRHFVMQYDDLIILGTFLYNFLEQETLLSTYAVFLFEEEVEALARDQDRTPNPWVAEVLHGLLVEELLRKALRNLTVQTGRT